MVFFSCLDPMAEVGLFCHRTLVYNSGASKEQADEEAIHRTRYTQGKNRSLASHLPRTKPRKYTAECPLILILQVAVEPPAGLQVV